MALPLRLEVEPFVKGILKSCHVLPSADEEKLCYVVGDSGLLCVVVQDASCWADKSLLQQVTGLPGHSLPYYAIVKKDGGFQWYLEDHVITESHTDRHTLKRNLLKKSITTNASLAHAFVESINRYYCRQVLEPSIRGFLGILEKQFPRNDLYLFELLQNAVDDGANRVSLKQVIHSGKESIHFCHNGRGFTPLDVLGLSSVGLSTKGDEEKRKIGFMGTLFYI